MLIHTHTSIQSIIIICVKRSVRLSVFIWNICVVLVHRKFWLLCRPTERRAKNSKIIKKIRRTEKLNWWWRREKEENWIRNERWDKCDFRAMQLLVFIIVMTNATHEIFGTSTEYRIRNICIEVAPLLILKIKLLWINFTFHFKWESRL